MDAASLFRVNLALIDRVTSEVCRRGRLPDADAEDFASTVRIALMEDDYSILRQWQGRSSLAGYLAIVIRRLLCDQRTHDFGRWRPSSEARRMGEAAVMLERLVHRDGRSVEEVMPIVRAVDASLSREDVLAMASRMSAPEKRPRPVELADIVEPAAPQTADASAQSWDAQRIARRTTAVVREVTANWPDEDVVILRLRFGTSMSIADISRMLRLPQRPLYRRIESLLAKLREALEQSGLDAATLSDVIGSDAEDLDFGLDLGKTEAPGPSRPVEPSESARAGASQ